MTVALLAVGLDPGIGMFHSDIDRRASLTFDAIEAVRPYVDHWLLDYLASSVFANRDFTELADGEVRLTHPLKCTPRAYRSVWRKVCEPVAEWLAQSFARTGAGTGAALTTDSRMFHEPQQVPASPVEKERPLAALGPRLPTFVSHGRGRHPVSLRAGLSENPVPRMCYECGKLLASTRRKFCSEACAVAFRSSHHRAATAGAVVPWLCWCYTQEKRIETR